MCQWCGPPGFASDDASVLERPAEKLVGFGWEGAYADAMAGATLDVLKKTQALVSRALAGTSSGLWLGPLVALSQIDGPQKFRFFAGVDGLAQEAGTEVREASAGRYVSAWHEVGDVLDHYERLLDWMRAAGHRWDKSAVHHREEYPLHADLAGPASMRLMLPLMA